MFIRIYCESESEILINLSFVKRIEISKDYRTIRYYFDGTIYDEIFKTSKEINTRYLEVCKLLEIQQ